MKILHLSDFHFGDSSLDSDTPYPTIFPDYIYKFTKYIKNSFSEIDLVIFTGDLVSKGKTTDFNESIIEDFFTPFLEYNIPVLLCNGNHDLKSSKIKKSNQFIEYSKFVLTIHKNFKFKLSSEFEINQSAYIDFPEQNILFISLNSCHNLIFSKKTGLSQTPTLPLQMTEKFMEELKTVFGVYFNLRNKVLLIHHPLEKLKLHEDSIKILKNYNIKLVLAGDSHQYSVYPFEGIFGITAGTLFGSNSIRWDSLNLRMQPNQFNYYMYDQKSKFLLIEQHIFDNGTLDWKKNREESKKLNFMNSWDIADFGENFRINSEIFEKYRIKFIFRDIHYQGDFIGVNTEQIVYNIFLFIEENQKKADLLREIIKQKIFNSKSANIIIIDKTRKLKGQIPSKFIEEC